MRNYAVFYHGIVESTWAPNPRKAVANILARHANIINPGNRNRYIGAAMNGFDNQCGDAGNLAYEVEDVIKDTSGNPLPEHFQQTARIAYLASEIAVRTNRREIDCFREANNFFEKQ